MTLLGIAGLGFLAAVVVNYLSDTLPQETRGSVCARCGAPLPFSAYLAWWRPCPHCGQRRWRHGIVWLTAVGMSLWLWLAPPKWGFWPVWWFAMYALAVIVMDVEHRLILNEVSAFGAVLGLVLGVWRHGWGATLWGGLAGGGMMLVLYLAGNGYALWKARRAGEPPPEEPVLGFGDVTLMAGLGLLLGWPAVLGGLVAAILLGGIFSILFLLYGLVRWRRLPLGAYIPYGPFLVLAALFLLLSAR